MGLLMWTWAHSPLFIVGAAGPGHRRPLSLNATSLSVHVKHTGHRHGPGSPVRKTTRKRRNPRQGQGTGTDSCSVGRCRRERALPAVASAQPLNTVRSLGAVRLGGKIFAWERHVVHRAGSDTRSPHLFLSTVGHEPSVTALLPLSFSQALPWYLELLATGAKTPEGCPRSRLAFHDIPIRAGDTGYAMERQFTDGPGRRHWLPSQSPLLPSLALSPC